MTAEEYDSNNTEPKVGFLIVDMIRLDSISYNKDDKTKNRVEGLAESVNLITKDYF